jgi:hypothetical protein
MIFNLPENMTIVPVSDWLKQETEKSFFKKIKISGLYIME